MKITLLGIPVVLDSDAPKEHIVIHPDVMDQIRRVAMPDMMVLYRGVGTRDPNGPMPTSPKIKSAALIIG